MRQPRLARQVGRIPRRHYQGRVPPGGQGVRLASAAASTFLFVREAAQSPLVTVGEGGEGRRGGRFRAQRFHFHQHYGRQYNYIRRDRYRRFDPPPYDRPYYGRPSYGPRYYDRPYDYPPRYRY